MTSLNQPITDSKHAGIETLRQQLVEEYNKLSALQQAIVQLFSVIYEPVSRGVFVTCLNQAGVQDKTGKPFTNLTIKPYIDRLIRVGVLLQDRGQGACCHPLLMEIATRDAVRVGQFETFAKVMQDCLPIPPRWKGGAKFFRHDSQLIREVRLGIYRNDIEFIEQQLDDYYKHSYLQDKISLREIYELVCNNPFDPEWLRALDPELYESVLASRLNASMLDLTPAHDAFSLLLDDCAGGRSVSDLQRIVLIEQLILRGRLPEAQQNLEQLSESYRSTVASLQGLLFFLVGDDERAIAHYTAALQTLRKDTGKRKAYFQTMSGPFFVLLLLKQGDRESLNQAAEYASLARQSNHWLSPIYAALERVVKLQQGDLAQREFLMNIVAGSGASSGTYSLKILLYALCLYWVDVDQAKSRLPKILQPFYQQAEASGYHWLAMEAADLLSRFKPRSPYAKQAANFRQVNGIRSLVSLLHPQEPWELCLKALANLQKEPETATKSGANLRLAWLITFYSSHNYVLDPREQKINAKGEWSKGRPIALKRLKKRENWTTSLPRICGFALN